MTLGCLYVVATPIGHLGDVSARLQDTLSLAQLILAENPRHTLKLLQHLKVSTPCAALLGTQASRSMKRALDILQAGGEVALVSDAGTPGIQDPGSPFVARCHDAGIRVSPIPGPSAVVAALSASGVSCDRFSFLGFFPKEPSEKEKMLRMFRTLHHPCVFYEAPHRLKNTADYLAQHLPPQHKIFIAREITKRFESMRWYTLESWTQVLKQEVTASMGECTCILEPLASEDETEHTAEVDRMLQVLLRHVSKKDAAKITSELTGLPKNKLYHSLHHGSQEE